VECGPAALSGSVADSGGSELCDSPALGETGDVGVSVSGRFSGMRPVSMSPS
jgi:hypothetical protein